MRLVLCASAKSLHPTFLCLVFFHPFIQDMFAWRNFLVFTFLLLNQVQISTYHLCSNCVTSELWHYLESPADTSLLFNFSLFQSSLEKIVEDQLDWLYQNVSEILCVVRESRHSTDPDVERESRHTAVPVPISKPQN